MQEKHNKFREFSKEVKERMEVYRNAGNFTLKFFGRKEKCSPYIYYPWQTARDCGQLDNPMLKVYEAYFQLRVARDRHLAHLFPDRARRIPEDPEQREKYIGDLKGELEIIKLSLSSQV